MNNDLLGRLERHIDGWIGEIPFEFQCSGSKILRFRIRAGEAGPSTKQRQLIETLTHQYEKLWPQISEKLVGLRPNTTPPSDLLPKSRVLLSTPAIISGVSGQEVYDFLLGYEFDGDEAQGTGYFFCFSDWTLRYSFKAN